MLSIGKKASAAVVATVAGIVMLAAPAEARRVSIDDSLIPDFLFSFGPPTVCSGAALCFSGVLPYSLDLGGGESSNKFFVNSDGVITFGTEFHAYDSLDALHEAGVDFAAPVNTPEYAPNLVRLHVTTEQDIREGAEFKLFVCDNFVGDLDFICTDTVDEFIAANNYNRYLDDVVIQAGAGFVVLRRGPGSPTGVATLYSADDILEFDLGITSFATDFDFAGQRNGGSDSFTFNIQAGVPEPAAWLMMILGFGVLGGAMRRRSVYRVPAIA